MKKIIVVLFMVMLAACGENYSEGSRIGVVTKLSYKGLIWKSWEGQMNLGGVSQDDKGNLTANVFDFNTSSGQVAKIQEAMKTGKRVELVYREWAIAPLSIENSHVIVEVKDVK